MTASPFPLGEVADLYRDLHAHPELSFAEHRTAERVAAYLRTWGYDVTTGLGGTGVVGVLDNGPGPTALLRADMDALPVAEQTGLDYASVVPGVMHACGHDVHVACLLGAAAELSVRRKDFAGRLLVLFQPAEEVGAGAAAMVADDLYEKVGRPDVVLGQHVGPMPAGLFGFHEGLAMAASDTLTVTLHGRGGHGSRPETTVDPVVMAAATVLRLQTIVSRETAGTETAVVTVGTLHAGTKENVIAETATLGINVRSFEQAVRERTLAAIERIVRAESDASDAPEPPHISESVHFPALLNDPDGIARTRAAFEAEFGAGTVLDPGSLTGSEDVGVLAEAAGCPCVFWILGGADPAVFAGAASLEDFVEIVRTLPSNHSPDYAPVIEPTLSLGIRALVAAAREWLPV
ncbi:MAG TPA: amidohydrolase [Marmoricola sp.]|jgi:hippurate hydrolase|nr:amidohydrolase [Marmoricola sp.]